MIGFTHDPLGDNEHDHLWPDDWTFGGANGLDPRADPRWMPTTYTYFGSNAQVLWISQTPLCDEEALDDFTKVATIAGSDPKWCWVKRPGEELKALPYTYNKATDSLEATV